MRDKNYKNWPRMLLVASLLVSAATVEIAAADVQLFATEADFGGSQYAPGGSQPLPAPYRIVTNPNPVPLGQIQQTNYTGLGFYILSTTSHGGGTVAPTDSLGDVLTYPATSLGGLNFTKNGLANMDNYNPAAGTGHTADSNLGTGYAGLSSPTGSLVINSYLGAYAVVTTGEMIVNTAGTTTESAASSAFINALGAGQMLAIDFTAPGGGTTLVSGYSFLITFGTFDSNPNYS